MTTTQPDVRESAISEEEFLSQAQAMVPGLIERSEESERTCRLPDATVAQLRAVNFVGAAVPVERGGLGLGFDVIGAATRTLAEGCGSTAWVAGNCALHSHMVGYFPVDVQQRVYQESTVVPFIGNGLKMTAAQANQVPGGFRLTGRWDFSSGILHADWTAVAAMTDVGPYLFLVHKTQFTIEETWDPHGMRGTGSHDTMVDDQLIEAPFAIPLVSLGDGTAPGMQEPLAAYHHIPIFSLAGSGIVNTVVGVARRAVAVFEGRSMTVGGGWTGTLPSTRIAVQELIGKASATLAACEALNDQTEAEIAEKAYSRAEYSIEDRIRWRRNQTFVTLTLADMVQELFAKSGGQALPWRNEINRAFREATSASHHFGSVPDIVYPAYAKVRFGLDPEYTLL